MTFLTVTAKGQVTLKKDVLRHLGLKPGDKLEVKLRPDGKAELGAPRKTRDVSELFGSLKPPPGMPPLSIEEMNDIIARGWAGELDDNA